MKILFHGENAGTFARGFDALVGSEHEIALAPDILTTDEQRQLYRDADVIVGTKFDDSLPAPERLRLFHVPGAGYDNVRLDQLPAAAAVCNCFGHEIAITEYVIAAILSRVVPLQKADEGLRRNEWLFSAASGDRVHDEAAGKTVGLLGYGHIGKQIARVAHVLGMRIVVANRTKVATSEIVSESFGLDELEAFCGSADFIVSSLPLNDETRGILGARAFAAMQPNAVVINVGRGGTIDEKALFEALSERRIGGAIIDTWYNYPVGAELVQNPANLPFASLDNITMTPHMSGWTNGTIRRRQETMADNIRRCADGQPLINLVKAAGA